MRSSSRPLRRNGRKAFVLEFPANYRQIGHLFKSIEWVDVTYEDAYAALVHLTEYVLSITEELIGLDGRRCDGEMFDPYEYHANSICMSDLDGDTQFCLPKRQYELRRQLTDAVIRYMEDIITWLSVSNMLDDYGYTELDTVYIHRDLLILTTQR